MKILDVGCSKYNKYKANSPNDMVIGIDSNPDAEPDVLHDLEKFPYPFKPNEFDFIWCHSTMEHTRDRLGIMNEFWRILKPTGTLEIHVPHISDTPKAWGHLCHYHAFCWHTFDPLKQHPPSDENYTPYRWEILYRRMRFFAHDNPAKDFMRFRLIFNPLARVIDAFANKYHEFWERFASHWIGGSEEIIYKLRPIKK